MWWWRRIVTGRKHSLPWRVRLSYLVSLALRPLGWLRRQLHASGHVLAGALLAWWYSRSFRGLLLGLPAVLVSLAAVALLLEVHFRQQQKLLGTYRKTTANAVSAKDWKKARVALERWEELEPQSDDARYQLALVLAQLGQRSYAQAVLRQLAPPDRQGHGPAHLLLAQEAFSSGKISTESFDLAQTHLRRARQAGVPAALVNTVQSNLYLAAGRYDEALPLLVEAAAKNGERRLRLAEIHLIQGRRDEAKRQATMAAEQLREHVRQNPEDQAARLLCAQANRMVGNLVDAEQVLRDGIALDADGPCLIALVKHYVWQAQGLARSGRSKDPRVPQLLQRAIRLLEQHGGNKPEILALLGNLYSALNSPEKAIALLQDAAKTSTTFQLRLATLLARQEEVESSQEQARQVLDACLEKLQQNPRDGRARAEAVQAAGLLHEYPQLISLLKEGATQTGGEQPKRTLSRAYLAWWDWQQRNHQQDARSLELLENAFALDPWNSPVLQRLMKLIDSDAPMAKQAQNFLDEQLASGKVPANAHMVIGTHAFSQGEVAKGRKHLELAYRREPQTPAIANNLAWVLANSETPGLQRALDLVQAALQKDPHNTQFLDTRGHIYLKMRRWQEATIDLARVLKAQPRKRELHEALAQTYRHLQMDDLAERHEQLAEGLKSAEAEEGSAGNAKTPEPAKKP